MYSFKFAFTIYIVGIILGFFIGIFISFLTHIPRDTKYVFTVGLSSGAHFESQEYDTLDQALQAMQNVHDNSVGIYTTTFHISEVQK